MLKNITNIPKKILIVGGVAGGASTAARLRRLNSEAEITIFEKGPYVAFANCGLPYYIGDVIKNEKKLLVVNPTTFDHKFQIGIKSCCEVTKIFRKEKEIEYKDLKKGTVEKAKYDSLVLSPGAEPFRPPVKGINLPGVFGCGSIPDARMIRGWIWNNYIKKATVVGGGFIGLEVAENLKKRGLDVTIVEMLDQVMPSVDIEMASILQHSLRSNGIDLILGDGLSKIIQNNPSNPTSTENLSVITKSGKEIKSDLVILALGVKPRIKLAQDAGLEIGEVTKAIKVDEYMRTSDPNIFACGDAVEVKNAITGNETNLPLAGPANRQARVIADNIMGRNRKFRGVQGTSVCGLFEKTVASTGLNEKMCKKLNIPYNCIYIHNGQHVEYYPGCKPCHMKLLFQPKDGKILGCQGIGDDGIERRIDVISTMIQMNGNVEDLSESELCYSPQYGGAKDVVNILGMIATNVMNGDVKLADWSKVDENYVLDVRNPGEKMEGFIPNAHVIPQCDILSRIDEIPKNEKIYVLCREGARAYNVCMLLKNKGFDTYLLSGGIHTYRMLKDLSILRGGAGDRPEGAAFGCCARSAFGY